MQHCTFDRCVYEATALIDLRLPSHGFMTDVRPRPPTRRSIQASLPPFDGGPARVDAQTSAPIDGAAACVGGCAVWGRPRPAHQCRLAHLRTHAPAGALQERPGVTQPGTLQLARSDAIRHNTAHRLAAAQRRIERRTRKRHRLASSGNQTRASVDKRARPSTPATVESKRCLASAVLRALAPIVPLDSWRRMTEPGAHPCRLTDGRGEGRNVNERMQNVMSEVLPARRSRPAWQTGEKV
jgi:hypothetical protein